MTKLTADVAQDFAKMSPLEQARTLEKLRRYVERGEWAKKVLAQLGSVSPEPG